MIQKLCAACYVVRSVFHISNIDTLQTIYFGYNYNEVLNIFAGNLKEN
jgi:hypothetical protein